MEVENETETGSFSQHTGFPQPYISTEDEGERRERKERWGVIFVYIYAEGLSRLEDKFMQFSNCQWTCSG